MKRAAHTCEDCDAVGVAQVFMTEQSFLQHTAQHKVGLILFFCKRCNVQLVNRAADRLSHSQVCAGVVRKKRAEGYGECPTCHVAFADGQSESSRVAHISSCDGLDQGVDGLQGLAVDTNVNDEEVGLEEVAAELRNEGLRNSGVNFKTGEAAFGDFGPEPPWSQDKNFRSYAEQFDVHQGYDVHGEFRCDAMLLNGLRAGGHADVSNAALGILFRILNTPEFRSAYLARELSTSLDVALAREEVLFGRQFQEVRHNGSVCFVRDLRDVVCDIFGDIALAESFIYENNSNETVNFQDLEYERSWCFFENGTARRKEAQRVGAVLQPLGLWLDEGEMDDAGNPIWMIAFFPLNVAPTLARRADCIFPIAYTYSASDITDCVRYLLPQLVALRKSARFVKNVEQPVIVSIEGISGDFPAVAKILMRVQAASAREACCSCLMEFDSADDSLFMNDPDRWLQGASPRTQVCRVVLIFLLFSTFQQGFFFFFFFFINFSKSVLEVGVDRMGKDRDYLPKHCGMRDACKKASVPLFAYFSNARPDLDCFGVCQLDFMHSLFLGLYKEIGQVLANVTLSDAGAALRFKQTIATLHAKKTRGLEVTLFRPRDVRKTTQTDLLHLLASGNLYAREYKAVAPLFPLLFHAANADAVSVEAISSLVDIIWMGTFVQSRFWPKNAPEDWWEEKRVFWIESYARFQRCFDGDEQLAKDRNLIKIHELLCHIWGSLRRHGSGVGTEGLEGIFHCFKAMETNFREQGAQVFKKFFGLMYAGQWVLGAAPYQKAVRDVIDKKNKWSWTKAGKAVVSAEVRAAAANSVRIRPDEINFIKWVSLETNSDSGTQRGVSKIYASHWHGRPKFDLLRLGDGEYLLLEGLFQHDQKVFGVGVVPENLDLRALPYHYRWPTLLFRQNSQLRVMELDVTTVHPVMAFDDFRREQSFWDAAKAGPGDRIMFHNIFATHGEFRNPRELEDWSKGGNGDEWWQ
jgi:hypothetical protein